MFDAILRLFGFRREGGAKPTAPRSPKWPAARRAHLLREPECAVCGTMKNLEVHHILPVSWPGGREAELDDRNMVTLCESPTHNCHLWAGHLGDWKAKNPDVVRDVKTCREKITNRPYPRASGAVE